MHFVMSVNDNPDFLSFIKPVLNYYKAININLTILILSEDEKIRLKYNDKNVKFFSPVPKIDSGIQSKMLRHYYPCTLDSSEVFVVTDIDQFILSFKLITDNIKNLRNIVGFGKNIFNNTELDGKTPMAPYITNSGLSKQLFNINKNISFEKFLENLQNFEFQIDGRESVKNKFNDFSDESLFRLLKKLNNIEFKNIDLDKDCDGERSIDRTPFHNIKNPNIGRFFWNRIYLNKKHKQDILNNTYFDLLPPRPNRKYLVNKILNIALEANSYRAVE